MLANGIIENDGNSFVGGTAGADIEALSAWDITSGNSNVIVAVFDLGISMDLQGNLNHPDLSDTNRIILGRKYTGNNLDTLNLREEYDVDNCYHGTFMSGLIGATQNNNEGISGVSPNSSLLVMKVGTTVDCGVSMTGVLKGVQYLERYASDNPGKRLIANFSFGGGSPSQIDSTIFNETYSSNILVVASAGNTFSGSVNTPAILAEKSPQHINHYLSVGTSTHNDLISWQSAEADAEDQITIVAPAGPDYQISQLNHGWYSSSITTGNILDIGSNQAHTSTDYYRYAGQTSGAAALTSGAAALVWSINADLNHYQIKQILLNSADTVGGYSYDANGWNNKMGYGRLNAYKALIHTIEYYGATLGDEKPQVTMPLRANIEFHEDVHLVSGSTLTIEARDTTVILSAASGTITIGGPPPSPKTIGGGRGLVQAPPTLDDPDPESRLGQLLLHPNYPNPFNPSTQIRWEMPSAGHARITVHDILGREVAVLTNGLHSAGSHSVIFDGSGLASGMYLFRLETPSGMIIRKMTLLK